MVQSRSEKFWGVNQPFFLHPSHRLGHSRGQERNKTHTTTGTATHIFLSRTGGEEVEARDVEGPEWRWFIPGSGKLLLSFATTLETAKLWGAKVCDTGRVCSL